MQIFKHDLLGFQLLYLGVGHPAGEKKGSVRNVLIQIFKWDFVAQRFME